LKIDAGGSILPATVQDNKHSIIQTEKQYLNMLLLIWLIQRINLKRNMTNEDVGFSATPG
jgi:hypothetical protein